MNNELEDISEASALLRILEIGKQEFAAGEYQLAAEYFAEQKRLRSTRRRFESAPASDIRRKLLRVWVAPDVCFDGSWTVSLTRVHWETCPTVY